MSTHRNPDSFVRSKQHQPSETSARTSEELGPSNGLVVTALAIVVAGVAGLGTFAYKNQPQDGLHGQKIPLSANGDLIRNSKNQLQVDFNGDPKTLKDINCGKIDGVPITKGEVWPDGTGVSCIDTSPITQASRIAMDQLVQPTEK